MSINLAPNVTGETGITDHFQAMLATSWQHLLQQKDNRIEGCVKSMRLTGISQPVDQILGTEFRQKTGRLAKTEGSEMEYKRRHIFSSEFEAVKLFDEFDATKLGKQSLPVSETLQELMFSKNRLTEKIILDAIIGTGHESGYGETAPTSVELPSSQIIPVNFVKNGAATNTGMTFDKIVRLRRLAHENEAFGQQVMSGASKLCLALNASAIEDLTHDIHANNRDYVTAIEKLRDGETDKFLGIDIIRTEQVNKNLVGSDTIADNVAWVNDCVVAGYRDMYKVHVDELPQQSHALQVRAVFAYGATRLEERGVWKLPCLVTA